jgi:choline-glycine betaine transporter
LIIKHFFQIIALIFLLICTIYTWGFFMGIHYDYKSTKSAKLMEKQAKREKKLAEKKAKRLAKEGPKEEAPEAPTLDASKPITLDFLTNPDKK